MQYESKKARQQMSKEIQTKLLTKQIFFSITTTSDVLVLRWKYTILSEIIAFLE